MYRCHKPRPTCQQMFHVKENTEGVCTAATSPAPTVSRFSMSKKTQSEDVPLPQALPHLSADVPCQRKHRGRMYRCHMPSPTCQYMFHVKENREGGCTAATSPAPPVSRCSMSKKTQREDVPLPKAPSADRWGWACGSGTSPLCVFFDMEHLLTGGARLVAAVHPPSVFSLSWNTHLSADVPCQRKHRGGMYRCHKPSPTCQQMFHDKENTEGGCTAATSLAPPVSRCSMSKKTQREDVPVPHAQPHLEHILTGGAGHVAPVHPPSVFSLTWNTPPVSRCSMTKKTQREDVPLPQALPHLSADVPCQRKHRGRMYRCHMPSPTCQYMFHVKENREGGCTAATSPAPPVSRCSMSKKTQREDVPLPQAPIC